MILLYFHCDLLVFSDTILVNAILSIAKVPSIHLCDVRAIEEMFSSWQRTLSVICYINHILHRIREMAFLIKIVRVLGLDDYRRTFSFHSISLQLFQSSVVICSETKMHPISDVKMCNCNLKIHFNRKQRFSEFEL